MDEHLQQCAECRREAFYFSEIASLVTRVETVNVRPDFNVRLRSAIQRHENAARQPRKWYQWQPSPAWRLAVGMCSVLLLFAVSYGSYHMFSNGPQQASVTVMPAPETAIYTGDPDARFETSTVTGHWDYPQGWSEIDLGTPEGYAAQEKYMAVRRGPGDFVLETVRLDDPTAKNPGTNYLMPTVRSDQVVQKVSY